MDSTWSGILIVLQKKNTPTLDIGLVLLSRKHCLKCSLKKETRVEIKSGHKSLLRVWRKLKTILITVHQKLNKQSNTAKLSVEKVSCTPFIDDDEITAIDQNSSDAMWLHWWMTSWGLSLAPIASLPCQSSKSRLSSSRLCQLQGNSFQRTTKTLKWEGLKLAYANIVTCRRISVLFSMCYADT